MNSRMGLIPFFAFVFMALPLAAQCAPESLTCDTVASDHFVCIHEGEKPEVAADSKSPVLMVTKGELTGESMDLGNEFELSTSLGDATEVNLTEKVSVTESQKAADHFIHRSLMTSMFIQNVLSGSSRPAISISALPKH